VPIAVKLQNAEGAVLETLLDPGAVLNRRLPNYDDPTFRLLTRIDWYGDVEFEAPEMALLLEELQRIAPTDGSASESDYLQSLKQIATRCGSMPGCRLRFIGD
jgi:Tfp pilus assembly protein PilN